MSKPYRITCAEGVVADYLVGMKICDIIDKWAVSRTTVYKVLHQAEVPLVRPRGANHDPAPWLRFYADKARTARIHDVGRRDAAAARAALKRLPADDSVARLVLQLRIDHPEKSSAELAAMCGMTRGAYAAKLWRLLQKGNRIVEAVSMDEWLRQHRLRHTLPKRSR
jgi:hypothetical protein